MRQEEAAFDYSWQTVVRFPLSRLHVSIMQKHVFYHLSVTKL